jgi:hypothetical protein
MNCLKNKKTQAAKRSEEKEKRCSEDKTMFRRQEDAQKTKRLMAVNLNTCLLVLANAYGWVYDGLVYDTRN